MDILILITSSKYFYNFISPFSPYGVSFDWEAVMEMWSNTVICVWYDLLHESNKNTNCTKHNIEPQKLSSEKIIIGFTFRNKVIRNKLIRSFLFFSTGQMDCVWRNHSYLYNNVPCSEVLNMISTTEKTIIWFKYCL